MFTLRGPRLIILLALILISITLYSFYPTDPFRRPHSPDEAYDHYEAGGIDSDHHNEPIIPVFQEGEGCDDGECKVEVGGKIMDEELRDGGYEADEEVGQKPIGVGKGLGEGLSEEVLHGGVIMPKLENATAKADLGRAAWRVMHLMTLKYPENPTADDRTTLKSFFHLFSRLYPCGECAEEFQKLLKEYPPQTSSRKTASMWLCSVHNMVNERLGKPEFDCLTLNETYDCGCGPEGEEKEKDSDKGKDEDEKKGGEEGTKAYGDQYEQADERSKNQALTGTHDSHLNKGNRIADDARADTDADEDEDDLGEAETLDVDEAEQEKQKLEDKIDGTTPVRTHRQDSAGDGADGEDTDGVEERRDAGDDDAADEDDEADETDETDEVDEGVEGDKEGGEQQDFRVSPVEGVQGEEDVDRDDRDEDED